MRRIVLLISLVYSVCAFAQALYPDSVLYAAYLRTDMRVWDKALSAAQFDRLSKRDKERYLNYEYGYVAVAIDDKLSDAEQHLADFEAHITAMESILPEALILTYRSGAAAYAAMLDKWVFLKKGLESFNLVKAAYELDPHHPMVLSLKGNVDFYAPKSFGGNKQKALSCFREAQHIYEQRGDTVCNWNYVATRLCIIQCEEKLGQLDAALRDARRLLVHAPGFVYLRDEYLPELEKKAQK